MDRSIFYHLFGQGKIPPDALTAIDREGLILSDEGICGSLTLRNFRAPGRYHRWKRSGFCGSIVLTREHLLAFQFSRSVIGLRWTDRQIRQLKCSAEGHRKLLIAYEAGVFNPEWSGQVGLRFKTPLAGRIVGRIRKQIRQARE